MEEKENKKSRFRSFLNDSIQLRFYRRENFEQIGSMDLSPRSIYIFLSSAILLVFILVFSLLAFTPLQRLVPRISNIENTKKFVELNTTLNDIEVSLETQDVYLSAFQKMLVGEESIDIPELEMIDDVKGNTESQKTTPFARERLIATSDDEKIREVAPEKNDHNVNVKTGTLFDEIESVDFVVPLNGIISADFEPLKNHLGIDIIAPTNTPVQAVRDGYIIIAGWSMDTGHIIGIQHDHNILSFYKHNSVLLKEKGNFVKAGEIIAIIGNSGKLTNGPHLHFELWHNGKPINPADYINLK